jgi:hypothetical protein
MRTISISLCRGTFKHWLPISRIKTRLLTSDGNKDKDSSLKAALSALKTDKRKIKPDNTTRQRPETHTKLWSSRESQPTSLDDKETKESNREPVTWENAPRLGIFDPEKFKNYEPPPSRRPLLIEIERRKKIEALNKVRQENPWMKQLREEKWKYPVDNDDFYPEEWDVSFHDHVHLEYLLDGLPQKGHARRFMELVVAGLQKNPYMTVDKKKEHVAWLKEYLKENESIDGFSPPT